MKHSKRSRLDRDLDEALDRATKGARRFRHRASDKMADAVHEAKKTGRHARNMSENCRARMPQALGCACRFAKRNPVLMAAGVAVLGYALVHAIRDKDDRG